MTAAKLVQDWANLSLHLLSGLYVLSFGGFGFKVGSSQTAKKTLKLEQSAIKARLLRLKKLSMFSVWKNQFITAYQPTR